MLPQNPPQPSCSYFPLKLSSVGIQTSKLMIESFVGVAVPATRQNCGSPVFVVQPVAPVVQPGGVLNVPPVIVSFPAELRPCRARLCDAPPCGIFPQRHGSRHRRWSAEMRGGISTH
jgi:hypothetical protein